ncbi:hypothetical protein BDV41DRAFT_569967 [Aspergillus transmontanensis]|uniref:Uncharacterized protein n=1 Tax=Aspergillus transmontanensis TaxID=1034304 RepID=A0A5N6VDZ7_9EURO|nr:hypothetical protein BDV41DRAFT_569967 [Aspergillus transmontanensis]
MGNISHPGDFRLSPRRDSIHYQLGNNILFAGYFSYKHFLSFLLPFFLFRFRRAFPRSRASIGKNLPLHSTINVDPQKMYGRLPYAASLSAMSFPCY